MVLNRVAVSVVEQVRGIHPEHVFTYKGRGVGTINNSGWKTARKKVGLSQVRVHDLKHTFGRRLRAANGLTEAPTLTVIKRETGGVGKLSEIKKG